MADVDVRQADDDERAVAGAVAARALRDNPGTIVLFGDDVLVRHRGVHEFFPTIVSAAPEPPFVALLGPVVVGVAGFTPPGHCLLSELADEPPEGDPPPVGTSERVIWWARLLATHDPTEPHWHIGPVGVDLGLQRLGIGRAV